MAFYHGHDDDSDQEHRVFRNFTQAPVANHYAPQNERSSITLVLKPKVFNCPIHGLIEIEQPIVKIIDTPYFQRLRNLFQLGAGSYVFPGATHNRFQHSIGTMYLGGKMANALRNNSLDGDVAALLTNKVILMIKIACLGHDMGHSVSSHMFDGLFIPKLLEKTDDKELLERLGDWEHEDSSEKLIEAAIRTAGLTNPDLYEDFLSDKDITYIKSLINPDRYPEIPYPELDFTYDILSNSRSSIDVDKFDYLERDCQNTGLRSAFRFQRLIEHCKVMDDGSGTGARTIAYDRKVAYDIYELFHTRYSLFKQVYSHRKVKCIEYMLVDAMLLADPVLQIGRKVLDLEAFTKLNDSIFPVIEMYSADTITNPEHRADMIKAQNVLNRLRTRDLYKYCAESLIPPHIKPHEIKSITQNVVYANLCKLYPETQLTQDDIIIQHLTLNYAFKDKNPVDNVRFYNSIYDTVSHHIPSEKISLLIPSQFSESYIRIYIKLSSREEVSRAARALDITLRRQFDEKASLSSVDRAFIQAIDPNNISTDSNNDLHLIEHHKSQMSQNNHVQMTTLSQSAMPKVVTKVQLGAVDNNFGVLYRNSTTNKGSNSQIHQTSSTRSNNTNNASLNSSMTDVPSVSPLGTPVKRTFSTHKFTTPVRLGNGIQLQNTPILQNIHEEIALTSSDDDCDPYGLDSQRSVVSTVRSITSTSTNTATSTKPTTSTFRPTKRQKGNDSQISGSRSILEFMNPTKD